jgi:hypothetical protein
VPADNYARVSKKIFSIPMIFNFVTIIYDFIGLSAHSCSSRLVICGAATMENGFQVTILDLEALDS